MPDLTTEYVSKICPELLESEVKILIDNLLDLYHPSEIYPQVVRVTAKSLFPTSLRLSAWSSISMAGIVSSTRLSF